MSVADTDQSENRSSPSKKDGGTFLKNEHLISRYENDFEKLGTLGKGGFGIVQKARHLLDGNIYAIKMIKLSKNDDEENKRILREIKYLSGLNNQYIVRYFQTWVEKVTNQEIINDFDDWNSDYDEETDSYEMVEDNFYSERSRAVGRRSSTHQNRKIAATPQAAKPWIQKLGANDNQDDGSQFPMMAR